MLLKDYSIGINQLRYIKDKLKKIKNVIVYFEKL
jgi:hypothetical protein